MVVHGVHQVIQTVVSQRHEQVAVTNVASGEAVAVLLDVGHQVGQDGSPFVGRHQVEVY